jgi:hypothetical protein
LSKYRDKREELFRRYFESSPDYESYLTSSPGGYVAKWREVEARVAPSEQQLSVIRSFRRRMPVLVLSGVWCGDCARQGPMLRAIEKANPLIETRWVENREHPDFQDELRISGAEKVPVAVLLNEDFHEVARFGDRHLSVYRRKLAKELGAACDPGLLPTPEDELAVELQEWIDLFERAQLMLRLAPALRQRYGD